MLSLARNCRLLPLKQLIRPRTFQTFMKPILRRPPNYLKCNSILRPMRFFSNIPSQQGKKTIGYWLMTCSGMVFVAVVLGITIIYYLVLVSIYTVLEEVVKKTVR